MSTGDILLNAVCAACAVVQRAKQKINAGVFLDREDFDS
jgi:hypothetical protein